MSAGAGARILVVDDTPANLKLLVDVLDASGYAASGASNGTDALAMIAANPPDLVLLDIMMPGMSGYEVCERLRANPDTALLPVVLCTSLDPQSERVKGIEAGADDFLTKPFDEIELLARVQNTVRVKLYFDSLQRERDGLQSEVEAQVQQLEESSARLE